MKRSEVNGIIKKALETIESIGFKLPAFVNWTPEEWENKGYEYDEIRENMLGWDVTDYGLGNFDNIGLVLITLRNGSQKLKKYDKTYAEKVFILRDQQISPMHFHWNKMEDIINRGGNNLIVTLNNRTKYNKLADTDVMIKTDGKQYLAPAGTSIRLLPGESITLEREVFHEIKLESGKGFAVAGEVSKCNDDNADNCFLDKVERFAPIDEDEVPYRLLCTEYPIAKQESKNTNQY